MSRAGEFGAGGAGGGALCGLVAVAVCGALEPLLPEATVDASGL